jgi:hypothetical protein
MAQDARTLQASLDPPQPPGKRRFPGTTGARPTPLERTSDTAARGPNAPTMRAPVRVARRPPRTRRHSAARPRRHCAARLRVMVRRPIVAPTMTTGLGRQRYGCLPRLDPVRSERPYPTPSLGTNSGLGAPSRARTTTRKPGVGGRAPAVRCLAGGDRRAEPLGMVESVLDLAALQTAGRGVSEAPRSRNIRCEARRPSGSGRPARGTARVSRGGHR